MTDAALILCQGPLARRAPGDLGFRIVLRASTSPGGDVNKYAVHEMTVDPDGKPTFDAGDYFDVFPFSPDLAVRQFNEAVAAFCDRLPRTAAWLEYGQLKALATPPAGAPGRKYQLAVVFQSGTPAYREGWRATVRHNKEILYSSTLSPSEGGAAAGAKDWLGRIDPSGRLERTI